MISISNLSKSFGNRSVLENISIEIGQEIVSILGSNGAGKTTLVNIICGLLKYDKGIVEVDGINPLENSTLVRKKIGLVPQETALYEYLTARENLEFHTKFYGIAQSKRKQKIQDALELAHLEERADDRVHTFSGGMKRRVALVRSLIHDLDILILDEPSLGIDVQNRNEIWNRILELRDTYNKIVMITTNYMDEADRLSDRCAIIDCGKIVALNSPSKLKLEHAGGIRLEATIEKSNSEYIWIANIMIGKILTGIIQTFVCFSAVLITVFILYGFIPNGNLLILFFLILWGSFIFSNLRFLLASKIKSVIPVAVGLVVLNIYGWWIGGSLVPAEVWPGIMKILATFWPRTYFTRSFVNLILLNSTSTLLSVYYTISA